MDNLRLAQLWEQMADLLEILGENPFKVSAYRRGARTIRKSPYSLSELTQSDLLSRMPGIGKALQSSAAEYQKTGKLAALDELVDKVPDQLLLLSQLGVAPKLVGRLKRELGIGNIADLQEALKDHSVSSLRGIGSKGEQKLKQIAARARQGRAFPAPVAEAYARDFRRQLLELPQIRRAEIAGSIRRGEELAAEACLVVAASLSESELASYVSCLPSVAAFNPEDFSLKLRCGLGLRLEISSEPAFFRALWERTGPQEHLRQVAELGALPEFPESEDAIYRAVGLPYISPLQRWGRCELDLARHGELPAPLSADFYRGDFHVHSDWSDGLNSLAQLKKRGEELGYEYIAVCDHSASLGIAGGLSPQRLRERNEIIDSLNASGGYCRLLKGIELEIGSGGQLDYSPQLLAELDIVVGALHRGFGQAQAEIMRRLRCAFSQGVIFILAHPTGRLLGRREGLAVDVTQLMDLAAESGVALELNANPQRLDLDAENLRLAKAKGISIAINTDSHSIESLGELGWGLKVATRAALTKEDILNSLDLDSLQRRIEKGKGGRY